MLSILVESRPSVFTVQFDTMNIGTYGYHIVAENQLEKTFIFCFLFHVHGPEICYRSTCIAEEFNYTEC